MKTRTGPRPPQGVVCPPAGPTGNSRSRKETVEPVTVPRNHDRVAGGGRHAGRILGLARRKTESAHCKIGVHGGRVGTAPNSGSSRMTFRMRDEIAYRALHPDPSVGSRVEAEVARPGEGVGIDPVEFDLDALLNRKEFVPGHQIFAHEQVAQRVDGG